MPLIFVIDGAVERSNLIRSTLEQGGYAVEVFARAQKFESVERELPDLFVIAVQLPDGSGIDLSRRIKTSHSPDRARTVLVAESREEGYRAVVESEAEDFIVSPFASRELISSVQASVRRALPMTLSVSSPRAAEIVIDSSAMRVKVRGNEISTTALEFHLIDYMARHSRKVLTRDALLDAVWGDLRFVAPRSVDACIGRIRRKIEPDPFSPVYLKTIRGLGYRLDAAPVWEGRSMDMCLCLGCTAARERPRTPEGMLRRRMAT